MFQKNVAEEIKTHFTFGNCLSKFISVINQLDAQNFCFTISLLHASTCLEHYVLIIRRSKLYYTASGVMILEAV